jgi:hypothetical protein
MTAATITNTDSGKDLTRSSGQFAPRLFNQSAADPVSGFSHQTAAAGARLFIAYLPTPLVERIPSELPSPIKDAGHEAGFDLPPDESFRDADAAAMGFHLARRSSRFPSIEVDLGSDL